MEALTSICTFHQYTVSLSHRVFCNPQRNDGSKISVLIPLLHLMWKRNINYDSCPVHRLIPLLVRNNRFKHTSCWHSQDNNLVLRSVNVSSKVSPHGKVVWLTAFFNDAKFQLQCFPTGWNTTPLQALRKGFLEKGAQALVKQLDRLEKCTVSWIKKPSFIS